MASNVIPSRIEDQHFDYKSNKSDVNINDATKDFINTETGINNINADQSTQNSISINPLPKEDTEDAQKNENKESIQSETSNNESKASGRLDSNTSPNVAPGLAEHSDNNIHPVTEMFHLKEPDPSIDDNLPKTVTLLKTPEGGKCYLVGTAHYSVESQNDVSKVIQAVQPHVVVIELCSSRIEPLLLDQDELYKELLEFNLGFNKIKDYIKRHGIHSGLFHVLYMQMSSELAKALGVPPGGEFRRAIEEAQKIPHCRILLGDRPIQITTGRLFSFLSFWQKIKMAFDLLKEKVNLTQEDVEKLKTHDSLEEMMTEFAEKYPIFEEVFMFERDIYLTHSLQMACRSLVAPDGRLIPTRVVGVVGMGHTFGITEKWGKIKRCQIPPILSIPPPSLSSKIFKFTLKASAIGTVIYVACRFHLIPTGIVQYFKSSMERLIKVSAPNH